MLQSHDNDYCPFHILSNSSPTMTYHLTPHKPCSGKDIINPLHAMQEIILIPALYLMLPVKLTQRKSSNRSNITVDKKAKAKNVKISP
jgi:hypothetical protein